MIKERWRPVQDYERLYEVSNLGRVRRIDLRHPARRLPGGFIRGRRKKGGYRMLRLCDSGRDVDRTLHAIVATAFHGKRPRGKECAHLDGKPPNNRAKNLAWVTPLENSHHKVAHGTQLQGEGMPTAKLTVKGIMRARRLRRCGWLIKEIAPLLGVNKSVLGRALKGMTWKHLSAR